MSYYYVVIDKTNKTLEVMECLTCLARLMDEIKEKRGFKNRWEVESRYNFFFNDTNNKVDFDTIYKYARKYTIIEQPMEVLV